MLKKILIAGFWLVFFGFFFLMLILKYKYLTNDTLQHWGSKSTLWLLFIILAFYFIKQRKIVLHHRMMISGFICKLHNLKHRT